MKKYESYFLFKGKRGFILLLSCILLLTACGKKNYAFLPEYQFRNTTGTPDYSNLDYWAAHPWKRNPADSVPGALRTSSHFDSAVDVFFIHPTTLTSYADHRWNADLDDARLNAKTDYSTILYQASVFNEKCRVFAPRYRQAHIRCFFVPDSVSRPYFDLAYEDIRTAFLYYMQNLNHGRPVIIASHSQGTRHAARLLKEFFDNRPLANKLVCAYIIGLPVADSFFTELKPCRDSASTGCIISWRTYKSGYTEPKFVARENFNAVVVNPLSWTTDTLNRSAVFNRGGVLKNFNKIVPHVVSARVHKNVLWCSKPNVPGKIFFTKKNYHIGDINLFYMNIRDNIAVRILAFQKKQAITTQTVH
jgi:hypothetical protein